MANVDPEVWALLEAEIKRNPAATLDELIVMAGGVSPAAGKLDRRQFNARYPLQIKRRLGIKGGGGGGGGRAKPKRAAAKGKVGRPRKVAAPAKTTGKRRGRPKKVVAAPAATGTKRRGRPPKNPVAVPAPTGTKRRGRPPGSGKKKVAATRGRKPSTAVAVVSSTGSNRDSIRQTLLGFAHDLISAAADAPKQLVKVLAGIDRYVDQISRS